MTADNESELHKIKKLHPSAKVIGNIVCYFILYLVIILSNSLYFNFRLLLEFVAMQKLHSVS